MREREVREGVLPPPCPPKKFPWYMVEIYTQSGWCPSLTLFWVGESEDMVVPKDDSRSSSQFLGLGYESPVYEGLAVWVWDYAHHTCIMTERN